jgi:acyl dehydratase
VSPPAPAHVTAAGGPYFEDLRVGDLFAASPPVTLTSGLAAVHQSIVGDRLRLALDATLARDVLGADALLAHPALVADVAIGQSTVVTQRVIANLFYRGLVFHRAPLIGDTLRTTTEVVALRQNARRPGRPATGLAALRIRTLDHADRLVLDFCRCAMLPIRDETVETGHRDDMAAIPAGFSMPAWPSDWRLDALAEAVPGPRLPATAPGTAWKLDGGDVVSSAPELARLTVNIAAAHHDASGGRRLVYGGHTIGLAASQAARALPGLVTIVAWHGCEHLAPVYEGDTLHSRVELEHVEPLPSGGGLAHLRSVVTTERDRAPLDVLDWRFVALVV